MGEGARATAGRPGDRPTCLGEADDFRDALLAVGARAGVAVEVRDLHAAVLAHLACVQLAQGSDHGGLGHGVRDVGPAPHLQAAQDVPLHRLQEVAVHPAQLLRPPEAAARRAGVLRAAGGSGWRGRRRGGGRRRRCGRAPGLGPQPPGRQQQKAGGPQRPTGQPVHGAPLATRVPAVRRAEPSAGPGSGLPARSPAPPPPAPARASARPPRGPPRARRGRGPAGSRGFPRGGEGAPRAAEAAEVRGARRGSAGHCRTGVSGRLGICSLLPILSASGPRSPRPGEVKAAAAAAWPPGGEGGERTGRRNLAETEAKAPELPERSRARLGAALRRALRRGPALAPERLALAALRRGRAGDGRVVLAAGRRASAVLGALGDAGRLRGGAESPVAGPAVLPARHTAKLSPGSRGAAASTGGRAGRCALRRGLCSARLLAASLPPPACLPVGAGGARGAGRGRRGGGRALLAPVSSPAAAAAMSAGAPKSLAASPGAVP